MYDIVAQIIGTSATPQDVTAICGVIIVVLTVVFIDLIRDIIHCFMRG